MEAIGEYQRKTFRLTILENKMDVEYWEKYYKGKETVFERSEFAQFVSVFLREKDSLLDCGCGDARDSVFFKQIGLRVTAIDQCESLIEELRKKIDGIDFVVDDFSNPSIPNKFDIIYSRFSLHSVPEEQENGFIEWCSTHTKKYLLIEARSDLNDDVNTTTHYRRNINLLALIKKLEKSFDIRYSAQCDHFSPVKEEYKTEDKKNPFVLRIVARSKNWK